MVAVEETLLALAKELLMAVVLKELDEIELLPPPAMEAEVDKSGAWEGDVADLTTPLLSDGKRVLDFGFFQSFCHHHSTN